MTPARRSGEAAVRPIRREGCGLGAGVSGSGVPAGAPPGLEGTVAIARSAPSLVPEVSWLGNGEHREVWKGPDFNS